MRDIVLLVDFCRATQIDIRWARKQIDLGLVPAIKPNTPKARGVYLPKNGQLTLEDLWQKSPPKSLSRPRRKKHDLSAPAALDFGVAQGESTWQEVRTSTCVPVGFDWFDHSVSVVSASGFKWLNIISADGSLNSVRVDHIVSLGVTRNDLFEVSVTLTSGRRSKLFQAQTIDEANQFVSSVFDSIKYNVAGQEVLV